MKKEAEAKDSAEKAKREAEERELRERAMERHELAKRALEERQPGWGGVVVWLVGGGCIPVALFPLLNPPPPPWGRPVPFRAHLSRMSLFYKL